MTSEQVLALLSLIASLYQANTELVGQVGALTAKVDELVKAQESEESVS